MTGYISLIGWLEPWFDNPWAELPEDLRQRIKSVFVLLPWDCLSADRRRQRVLLWDYDHDPMNEADRNAMWELQSEISNDIAYLKAEIDELAGVPTFGLRLDFEERETKRAKLRQRLSTIKAQEHALLNAAPAELRSTLEKLTTARREFDVILSRAADKDACPVLTPSPKTPAASAPSPAGSAKKRRVPHPALLNWWRTTYLKEHPDPDKRPDKNAQRAAAIAAFPDHTPPSDLIMQGLRADKDTPAEWREAGRRPKTN